MKTNKARNTTQKTRKENNTNPTNNQWRTQVLV